VQSARSILHAPKTSLVPKETGSSYVLSHEKEDGMSAYYPKHLFTPRSRGSNWVFFGSKQKGLFPDDSRVAWDIPFIDAFGKISLSVYGYWNASPTNFIISLILTRYRYLLRYFRKHHGTYKYTRWNIRSFLIRISVRWTVEYMDSDYLGARAFGIIRSGGKNLPRALRSLGSKTPTNDRNKLPAKEVEVLTVCLLLRLNLYSPGLSPVRGDKIAKFKGKLDLSSLQEEGYGAKEFRKFLTLLQSRFGGRLRTFRR